MIKRYTIDDETYYELELRNNDPFHESSSGEWVKWGDVKDAVRLWENVHSNNHYHIISSELLMDLAEKANMPYRFDDGIVYFAEKSNL